MLSLLVNEENEGNELKGVCSYDVDETYRVDKLKAILGHEINTIYITYIYIERERDLPSSFRSTNQNNSQIHQLNTRKADAFNAILGHEVPSLYPFICSGVEVMGQDHWGGGGRGRRGERGEKGKGEKKRESEGREREGEERICVVGFVVLVFFG